MRELPAADQPRCSPVLAVLSKGQDTGVSRVVNKVVHLHGLLQVVNYTGHVKDGQKHSHILWFLGTNSLVL